MVLIVIIFVFHQTIIKMMSLTVATEKQIW